MLYPILFEPILKPYIWGGERIARVLGRGKPGNGIGESWDIVCRSDDMGIAANGKYSGKRFIDILNMDREKFLGYNYSREKEFPLLVKIIDSKNDLSVQVHPTDNYAVSSEKLPYGKSEMWYVLEPPDSGEIILGIKPGTTREELRGALDSDDCMKYFSRLKVKRGDTVNIPAGMVHALTAGAMVLEVQQNSDSTYRIYDYGRLGSDGRPRELHIDKALDVIDFDGVLKTEYVNEADQDTKTGSQSARITKLIDSKHYRVNRYDITDSHTEYSDPNGFYIFTCVDGNCEITAGKYCMDIRRGDSVFIPAALGEYRFEGECSLIRSCAVGKSEIDNINKMASNA